MATQTEIHIAPELKSGAELIKSLKSHWQHNDITINDDALWQIYREADVNTWRSLIQCCVTLIGEGYEHPKWRTPQCQQYLGELLDATETDKWARVLSIKMKGKSHPFKTAIWRVSRMAVEIVEPYDSPFEDLFDING